MKPSNRLQLITLNIPHLKESAKKKTTPGLRARHKLKILERDNFKCTRCGTESNLTIAHTTPPKRNKKRNSTSYNINTCKTLCEECHLLYDNP